MFYPEYIADLIDRLERAGYQAFIVGGSLRDTLLGRIPNDFDITTSALPEQTLEVFRDLRTIPTGLKHGTVTVIAGGEPVEITTFRVDGEYRDSRHPDTVSFTDSITEDLSRRDFTVNAMAYNDRRGLIDPFGGREDLEAKIIRAVGDPERRFDEDALRIMRAFRFSAQLGFEIDKNTLAAAHEKREGLSRIARERISAEFLRLICSPDPSYALNLMIEADVLRHALGDYTPTKKTISALKKCNPTERVRLGLLLCEADKESREEILKRLRLSSRLCSNVMTISKQASKQLSGDDRDARIFIAGCGELISDTLDVARAIGNLDPDFSEAINRNLSDKICTSHTRLAIKATDLMAMGIKGKQIGETMSLLFDKVLDDPALNDLESLKNIAKQANNIAEE